MYFSTLLTFQKFEVRIMLSGKKFTTFGKFMEEGCDNSILVSKQEKFKTSRRLWCGSYHRMTPDRLGIGKTSVLLRHTLKGFAPLYGSS